MVIVLDPCWSERRPCGGSTEQLCRCGCLVVEDGDMMKKKTMRMRDWTYTSILSSSSIEEPMAEPTVLLSLPCIIDIFVLLSESKEFISQKCL
jgi:hypothetical protein